MNEAQYFEQFAGDTPIVLCLGMTGGDDYTDTYQSAQKWLEDMKANNPHYAYDLDYRYSLGSPFGCHQFTLVETRLA